MTCLERRTESDQWQRCHYHIRSQLFHNKQHKKEIESRGFHFRRKVTSGVSIAPHQKNNFPHASGMQQNVTSDRSRFSIVALVVILYTILFYWRDKSAKILSTTDSNIWSFRYYDEITVHDSPLVVGEIGPTIASFHSSLQGVLNRYRVQIMCGYFLLQNRSGHLIKCVSGFLCLQWTCHLKFKMQTAFGICCALVNTTNK